MYQCRGIQVRILFLPFHCTKPPRSGLVQYMRKYFVKGFVSCKGVMVYGISGVSQLFLTLTPLFLTYGFFMGKSVIEYF